MSCDERAPRIAIIGGGNMGSAIMGGWIASDREPAASLAPGNFIVANPGEARRARLLEDYGCACVADAREIDYADIVVLAVKPQVMMGVLETMADHPAYSGGERGPLFVSIAAGLTTDVLERALPSGARLVRTMPNMPLLVGAGATGVARGRNATDEDLDLVCRLFSCLGVACVVPEDQIDAVGALSGSGPAYFAMMIESLSASGQRHGLSADVARELAVATAWGTSKLIVETGRDVAEVRTSICSPGGTTLAALAAMGARGFDEAVEAGIAAAISRSEELARS